MAQLPNGSNNFLKTLPDDFETLVIKGSRSPERFASKCIAPAIVPSMVHAMDFPSYEECEDHAKSEMKMKPYFFGRRGHPTRDVLEALMGTIENCKHALTYSSGSAAVNSFLQTFLEQGDHVVAMETMYGGTTHILNDFRKFGVDITYDNSFEAKVLADQVKASTKVVWLESPANPLMMLIDIGEVAKLVKAKNSSCLLVVDNTFLTPMFQRPLELGADVSLYSCSKYLNGHADMFMGALLCNNDRIYEALRIGQEGYGAIPSPFDCYNLIRSLKTLPLRMKQHSENGQAVAEFLESHPCVEKVLYPGLKSHPQHALALKQQHGNCGAIGIYLKGGLTESYNFLKSLKLVMMAPSIGTDFSVANLPTKLSHGDMPKLIKDRLGITDNFIRLSVGLENANAIIQDLDQALKNSIKI